MAITNDGYVVVVFDGWSILVSLAVFCAVLKGGGLTVGGVQHDPADFEKLLALLRGKTG